jgi:hypothetical protein
MNEIKQIREALQDGVEMVEAQYPEVDRKYPTPQHRYERDLKPFTEALAH